MWILEKRRMSKAAALLDYLERAGLLEGGWSAEAAFEDGRLSEEGGAIVYDDGAVKAAFEGGRVSFPGQCAFDETRVRESGDVLRVAEFCVWSDGEADVSLAEVPLALARERAAADGDAFFDSLSDCGGEVHLYGSAEYREAAEEAMLGNWPTDLEWLAGVLEGEES